MLAGHQLHGLAVATELPPHGLREIEPRPADLMISRLASPLDWNAAGASLLDRDAPFGRVRLSRMATGHALTFGGHYEASLAEDRLDVRGSAVDDDTLAVFAYGTGVALWLALSGELVLHASAVLWERGVIAHAAPSGGGKSTLALAACEQGARLVSDDALRVRVDGGRALAWAGTAELRSRDERETRWRSRRTSDGRLAFSPPAPEGEGPWPLRALVLPRLVEGGGQPAVAEVPARRALPELGGHVRAGTLDDPELRRREFAQLADLVAAVPILSAEVPPRMSAAAEVGQSVRQRVCP